MHLTATVTTAIVFIAMGSTHRLTDTVQHPSHIFGIYGGKVTDVRKRPYTAAIYSKSTGTFKGNGVILSRYWILVTAYEVDGFNVDDLAVRVGSDYALRGGQSYNVSSIVRHEDFSQKYYGDIALLKTSGRMFTPYSDRVILAYHKTPDKSVGLMTGFGSNQESSDFLLREANFTVIPYKTCVKYYNFLPTTGVFCANSKIYTAADDDVGAPLMRGPVLIGNFLGSYGTKPGIYNEISYWRDWIQEHIKHT